DPVGAGRGRHRRQPRLHRQDVPRGSQRLDAALRGASRGVAALPGPGGRVGQSRRQPPRRARRHRHRSSARVLSVRSGCRRDQPVGAGGRHRAPTRRRGRSRRRPTRCHARPLTLQLDTVEVGVTRAWADDILPALERFITIPALSPSFDADWEAHGHIAAAVDLIADWCRRRPIDGLTVSIEQLPGLTPLVLLAVPAFGAGAPADTVVLYGHLDKQPEMEGWRDGLGPWTPVLDGDRLYGRGGADDGYAVFASLVAIEAVRASGG